MDPIQALFDDFKMKSKFKNENESVSLKMLDLRRKILQSLMREKEERSNFS